MDLPRAVLLTLSFLGFLVGHTCVIHGDEKLDKELRELDKLRSGVVTPFAQIEDRAQQLLEQHPAAEDHGRIYYQLAHTYAQGGISIKERAERVVAYAKKGLEYPLDPIRTLRLYNYWGDGLRMANRAQPFPERRKAAAKVYLKGLKEAEKYEIPDEPPQEPIMVLRRPKGPVHISSAKPLEQIRKEMAAANEKYGYERDLFWGRTVLLNQLMDVYRRKPYAATELLQMARETLDDPDTVLILIKRLEEKGALKDD